VEGIVTYIYPGEHLVEELKTLEVGAAELARQLGVPTIQARDRDRPERKKVT
jgi:hypothetical protein